MSRGALRTAHARRVPLPISAAPVPFTVESRDGSLASGEWIGGARHYPAECTSPASGTPAPQLTLSPPYLRYTGGSVKVVSLIRFNCLHYCCKGSAVFIAHYDFEEVQINISERRRFLNRYRLNMSFTMVRDIIITAVNYEDL